MATNEIYPFGTGGTEQDGDVLPLVDYAGDADRVSGHKVGLARRNLMNTVLRQVSHMSAGVAQFIANRYGPGVVDDGDLNKIEAGLLAAVEAIIADNTPDLSSLLAHLADTANPHEVNAAQIGAAVAGHGHNLATTSEPGFAELATDAEALLGTSPLVISTTALAAVLDARGLWDRSVGIAGPVDWDTLTDTRVCVVSTNPGNLHSPPPGADRNYSALIYKLSNTASLQIALDTNPGLPNVFVRKMSGSTWGDWQTIFTDDGQVQMYTSSALNMGTNNVATLAHGLGGEPDHIQVWIEWLDGNSYGYAAGAKTLLATSNTGECTVRFDATNLYVMSSNQYVGTVIKNDGTGTGNSLPWSSAYFRLRVRAFKYS